MNDRHVQKRPFNTTYFKEYYKGYRNSIDDLFPSEKRFFKPFLDNGRRLLDVGCAIGGFYEIVSSCDPNIHYTGVDVAEELVSVAQQRFKAVRFEVSDGVNLPFQQGEFDRVLSLGTTVHDPKWDQLLTRCYDVCSEKFLFDLRICSDLNTINSVDQGYVQDGAEVRYPYVVIAWTDFKSWIASLKVPPAKVEIFGYWGSANADTTLPVGYERICMACVVIHKCPEEYVGKVPPELEYELDLPMEFVL